MLELLLLRHGIAEERSAELADGARALTALGRSRTRAVAERLVELGLGCDQLISSPLLRARQTAEIAAAAGLIPQGSSPFSVDPELAPGGDPLPLLADLRRAARRSNQLQRVALVGHEPDLGDLAARLLGAPVGAIALKKAGVALLVLGPGQAQLKLLLAPRQILNA